MLHEVAHMVKTRIILCSTNWQTQAEIFIVDFCFLRWHTWFLFQWKGKNGGWIHHNPNARKPASFNCSGILVVVLRNTQAHWRKEVRQGTGWRKTAQVQTAEVVRWLAQDHLDICVRGRASGLELSAPSHFLNHKTQVLPRLTTSQAGVFFLFLAHR